MSFDEIGRLTQATIGAKTNTYTYGGVGSRLTKYDGFSTQTYHYNEFSQLSKVEAFRAGIHLKNGGMISQSGGDAKLLDKHNNPRENKSIKFVAARQFFRLLIESFMKFSKIKARTFLHCNV